MTYAVLDACIKCKYTDCVEVCPWTASTRREHAGHPSDECIDCGVCEPSARRRDQTDTEPGLEKWLELNRQYSEQWPNITVKKDAMPTRTSSRRNLASLRSISRRIPAAATDFQAGCTASNRDPEYTESVRRGELRPTRSRRIRQRSAALVGPERRLDFRAGGGDQLSGLLA